jgi:hypothetical protein
VAALGLTRRARNDISKSLKVHHDKIGAVSKAISSGLNKPRFDGGRWPPSERSPKLNRSAIRQGASFRTLLRTRKPIHECALQA